jgi:uncharacterized protein YjaZ
LESLVPLTVAHEMHHAARLYAGPGLSGTLGDHFVIEGTAVAFEEQAYAELAHGHWEELLDVELEREVWMEAQPELFDPLSLQEYRFWFDGAGPYPDGTGYAVGLGFVRSYLERHRGMDPADLAFVDYGEVIEESGYAP